MGLELREIPSKAKKAYGISGGAYVYKTTNREWFEKLGLQNGYIITDINGKNIKNIDDILQFKKENAKNGLENSIYKMGVINRRGQQERFIFK